MTNESIKTSISENEPSKPNLKKILSEQFLEEKDNDSQFSNYFYENNKIIQKKLVYNKRLKRKKKKR